MNTNTLHRSDFIPNRDLITTHDLNRIMRDFHKTFVKEDAYSSEHLVPSDLTFIYFSC